MRMIKFGRWLFTVSDIEWLKKQSLHNELAADLLVRYNRRHATSKRSTIFSRRSARVL